jgi:hypothetical protein
MSANTATGPSLASSQAGKRALALLTAPVGEPTAVALSPVVAGKPMVFMFMVSVAISFFQLSITLACS